MPSVGHRNSAHVAHRVPMVTQLGRTVVAGNRARVVVALVDCAHARPRESKRTETRPDELSNKEHKYTRN